MALEAVIEQALKLSVEDRTELVARLLDSLAEAGPVDAEREAAWTDVIDRRLRDAREGRVEMVDAGEALGQARAAIAARQR